MVRGELDGACGTPPGFGGLVADQGLCREVGPRVGEAGLKLGGPLELDLSLVVASEVGEQHAEVVDGGRVVGVLGEQLAQELDALLELARSRDTDGVLKSRRVQIGPLLDEPCEHVRCVGPPLHRHQRAAEVVVDVWLGRGEAKRLPVGVHRVVGESRPEQGGAEIGPAGPDVAPERHGFAEVGQCLVGAGLLQQDDAEQVPGVGVVPPGGDELPVDGLGVGESALVVQACGLGEEPGGLAVARHCYTTLILSMPCSAGGYRSFSPLSARTRASDTTQLRYHL